MLSPSNSKTIYIGCDCMNLSIGMQTGSYDYNNKINVNNQSQIQNYDRFKFPIENEIALLDKLKIGSKDMSIKNEAELSQLKRAGKVECETCKTRKYQDGSNDPGVSFKSAAHIDPSASASVVMSHEMEHVSNEKAKANSENKEIVSQNVSLSVATCPECGRSYVSGGQTTTTTKTKDDNKFKNNFDNYFGRVIDTRV